MTVLLKVDEETYNRIINGEDKFILCDSFPDIARTSLPFAAFLSTGDDARATAYIKCTGYTTKAKDTNGYAYREAVAKKLVRLENTGRTPYFWRLSSPTVLKDKTKPLVRYKDITNEWYYCNAGGE